MKCLRFLALLLTLVGLQAQASDLEDLQSKLAGFSAFYADFNQTLTTKAQQQGVSSSGYIALKKPHSLMLHTLKPDEQVLFTKDEAVYLYDPFVNQVTIYALRELQSSPFFLLTSMDRRLWDQYVVSKEQDSFTLTPKQPGEFSELKLTFEQDTLSRISIKMRDGSLNSYALSGQRQQAEDSLFVYAIPADAEVDDGRRTD
ncbi:MAG: outer membrane lipoprotein chaperone LolA [Succinivibrio sp.]|nr:outer membrane lipoprotein chaperone LolA [Succinivibrio sp.]